MAGFHYIIRTFSPHDVIYTWLHTHTQSGCMVQPLDPQSTRRRRHPEYCVIFALCDVITETLRTALMWMSSVGCTVASHFQVCRFCISPVPEFAHSTISPHSPETCVQVFEIIKFPIVCVCMCTHIINWNYTQGVTQHKPSLMLPGVGNRLMMDGRYLHMSFVDWLILCNFVVAWWTISWRLKLVGCHFENMGWKGTKLSTGENRHSLQ